MVGTDYDDEQIDEPVGVDLSAYVHVADKSAVGTINRPLRVHHWRVISFIGIIASAFTSRVRG